MKLSPFFPIEICLLSLLRVFWHNHKFNKWSFPYPCKKIHFSAKNTWPYWVSMLYKLSGKLQGPSASLPKTSSSVISLQQIFCIFPTEPLVILSVFSNLCNDPELDQFLANPPPIFKSQHCFVSTSYHYFSVFSCFNNTSLVSFCLPLRQKKSNFTAWFTVFSDVLSL